MSAMTVLPIVGTIILLIISFTLIIVPFVPSAYSPHLPQVSIDGKDPKSDINNLTDYGKNLVYAGISILLIVIVGFLLMYNTLSNIRSRGSWM